MTIRKAPRRKLIRRHDAFIKRMLDQPGVARSLLREQLPPEQPCSSSEAVARTDKALAQLADEEPERIAGSFISTKYRESRTDRLYRLRTRSSRTVFLYVLIEHKSVPDPRLGLQLLTYIERIYIWWAETHGRPVDGRVPPLPAVLPLVIYNGKAEWNAPLSFADGIDADPLLRPWLLDFPFPLIDLYRTSDADLSANPKLRAGLMMLRIGGEHRDLQQTLRGLARVAAAFGGDDLFALAHYVLEEIGPGEEVLIRAVMDEIAPEKREEMMQTLGDVWRARLREELRDTVRDEVRAEMRDSVREEVRAEMRDSVREEVRAEMRDSVREEVQAKVRASVADDVRAEIRDSVRKEVRTALLLEHLHRRNLKVSRAAQRRLQAAGSEQLDAWLDELMETGRLDSLLSPSRRS